MPGRIGEIFGSYELIQFLGRGGFAEVYLGKHTQLPQQMAAIKILDKQLIIPKSQQFQREASIVATLRHPNIVQMYDYNVYSNPNLTATLVPYIVMEYAPNKSLRVKHQRGLALPIKTIITYTRQIADALQYAHDHGVMHLDVKPENILINTQGKLLLSDFGLATLLTEEEKTGDIQGTLSYMSPEQLDGKPGFASDQYALGVMAYEWISGHLPFTGHSVKEVIEKHLKTPPPSLLTQIPTLPAQAEDVVFKALAKNVADRFPTIEAFAEALDQTLSLPKSKSPAATPQLRVNPTPGLPPDPNANPQPSFPWANPQPAVNPGAAPSLNVNNPLTPLPAANPAGASASLNANNPWQPPPAVNPISQPGHAPAYSNPPSFPGMNNQAAHVNAAPPLTPHNGASTSNSGPLPAFPPAQPNAALPLNPPTFNPGGSTVPPVQANPGIPSFAFPVNAQPGSSFFPPMNTGTSPFQNGPPPGMQSPGTHAAGSPFLNTMPGAPSATTIFGGLPGSPSFPGTGAQTGPGPLPPYLAGGTSGQYTGVFAQEKSLSNITRTVLKRPPTVARRRRQPLLIAGLLANVLGLIFIGPWLIRTVPSYHNLTAAWLLIFALVGSIGATVLFFNSGNKTLNSVLSLVLAIYWGFVGNALGNVTNGSFLFDPSILAFTFFLGSLVLHLSLAFARR